MKFYLYIKESKVRLIPAEKIPEKPSCSVYYYWEFQKYQRLVSDYESALQIAKEESIRCSSNEEARDMIYKSKSTVNNCTDKTCECNWIKEGHLYGPFEGYYCFEERDYKRTDLDEEPRKIKVAIISDLVDQEDTELDTPFVDPPHPHSYAPILATYRRVKKEEKKEDSDLLKLIDEKHAQLEREDRSRRVTNSSQLQVMAGPNFKKEEEQEEDQKILWKRALEHCGSKMDPVKWLSDNFTITRK